MSPRMNRRPFLKGMGGAMLGLPLMRFMTHESSAETDQAIPKRVLFFFTPGGTVRFNRISGVGPGYELGTTLAPLIPHRNELLFLDGVGMNTDVLGPGDGHQKGMGQLLTAQPLMEGELFEVFDGGSFAGWGGGISVDQLIARNIGLDTPFSSLHLGVQTEDPVRGGLSVLSVMSYEDKNRPVPCEDRPDRAFERIFGLSPSKQISRQKILDLVHQELKALEGQIGVSDKDLLNAHLQSVEEMEQQIQLMSQVPTECTLDPIASIPNRPQHYEAIGKQQIDLMVHALRCDLTRVGTLQWSTAQGGHVFQNLDLQDHHHHMTHIPEWDDNPQRIADLANVEHWYAQQFAYLLDQMKSVPEGDGTLLDHSLVVWVNELNVPWMHTHDNIPFVLAGGCKGQIQKGQRLHYESANHNDLWITVLAAMGVEVSTFGHPDFCTGGLTGIL